MNRGTILLIDDEEKLRHLLKRIISLEGFTVLEADNLKAAARQLDRESIQVILCDVKLPDGSGLDFIAGLRAKYPLTEIIMLTAYGNIAGGVQAIQQGAFDYLTKGNDNDRIIPLIERAIEKIRLQKRVLQLEKQVGQHYSFETILGDAPSIKAAIGLAMKVAPTDATVMLLGETGTGKEVFAQAIHNGSKRATHAFVPINVSSFSKELLESELFGHRAGAFTSAVKDKKGLIEEADQGTLFLDEIGEMAFDLQAKLLRVLETNEFIKIGDTKPTKVNVRFITATNRNLEKEAAEGRFREDLFYRLNSFTIHLPALRDRQQDIPQLANYFLGQFAIKTNPAVNAIKPDFMEQLQLRAWKGNIRELKNVIERAVILSTGSELTLEHLTLNLQGSSPDGGMSAFELASVEKLHIQRTLNHTGGNKMAAAKLLNIGLTTLYRKIEEYKLGV